MIVYVLCKRVENNYFNLTVVKVTTSVQVKDKWIKAKNHFFSPQTLDNPKIKRKKK